MSDQQTKPEQQEVTTNKPNFGEELLASLKEALQIAQGKDVPGALIHTFDVKQKGQRQIVQKRTNGEIVDPPQIRRTPG